MMPTVGCKHGVNSCSWCEGRAGLPEGRWDEYIHPQNVVKGEKGKKIQGCPVGRKMMLGMRLEQQREPCKNLIGRRLCCRNKVKVRPNSVRRVGLEVVRFDLWCC